MKKVQYVIFIVGLAILILLFSDIVLWIVISEDYSKSLEQVKLEYLNYFPEIIQNAVLLTLLSIFLGIIASACFYYCRKHSGSIFLKKLNSVLLVISIIITSWMAFTLM